MFLVSFLLWLSFPLLSHFCCALLLPRASALLSEMPRKKMALEQQKVLMEAAAFPCYCNFIKKQGSPFRMSNAPELSFSSFFGWFFPTQILSIPPCDLAARTSKRSAQCSYQDRNVCVSHLAAPPQPEQIVYEDMVLSMLLIT